MWSESYGSEFVIFLWNRLQRQQIFPRKVGQIWIPYHTLNAFLREETFAFFFIYEILDLIELPDHCFIQFSADFVKFDHVGAVKYIAIHVFWKSTLDSIHELCDQLQVGLDVFLNDFENLLVADFVFVFFIGVALLAGDWFRWRLRR